MSIYFIRPSREALESALESWNWVGLEDKVPFAVTAFGDVFFEGHDGIHFLDSIEGVVSHVCETRDQLNAILSDVDAKDHYLLAGFVERLVSENILLDDNECYDFELNPSLGGEIAYDNIGKRDFVVALNLSGQVHQQIQDLPEGAKINQVVFEDDAEQDGSAPKGTGQ